MKRSPGQPRALREVLAVDDVAEAADRHAHDGADRPDIHGAGDVGHLREVAVAQTADRTADQRSVDGDAAGVEREYLAEIVLEVAPVFDDVEAARADDAADNQRQRGVVDHVLRIAHPAPQPGRDGDADDDGEGRKDAVPGDFDAGDIDDCRVDSDFDLQERVNHRRLFPPLAPRPPGRPACAFRMCNRSVRRPAPRGTHHRALS